MEDEEEKRCSFCFGATEAGDMFSPCCCKGTLRWVHRGCLDKWRIHAKDVTRCPTCKFVYKTEQAGVWQWISAVANELGRCLGLVLVFELVNEGAQEVSLGVLECFSSYTRTPEGTLFSIISTSFLYHATQQALLKLLNLLTPLPDLLQPVAPTAISSARHTVLSTSLSLAFPYNGRRFYSRLTSINHFVTLPSIIRPLLIDSYRRICKEATSKLAILECHEY